MQTQLVTWAIDPAHSGIEFSIRHMMFAKVRGAFRVENGAIELADGSNIPSAIEAAIDVASVDTRESQRDDHLRSPDFFDAGQHRLMTFKSSGVDATSETAFSLAGDLTIKGITRAIVLAAEYEGRGVDPWGNERIAYSATTRLNRKDFGLGWTQVLETGGVMVGEEVEVTLSIQALRPKG